MDELTTGFIAIGFLILFSAGFTKDRLIGETMVSVALISIVSGCSLGIHTALAGA